MRALVAFIGAALVHIASCHASPADVEAQRGEGACDEPRFTAGLQECDTKFDRSVALASKADVQIACSAVDEYKACLSSLMTATECDNRNFLSRQPRPAQTYLEQEQICAGNMSELPQHAPPRNRNRAPTQTCAKDVVWNTQFLCAQKFHKDVENDKEDEGRTGNSQICRSVKRYYRCLNTVLGDESCQSDPEFMQHAEYFPTVLTHKYRDLCPAELGLKTQRARVKVLRAIGVVGQGAEQACEQDKLTKEFFACGLLFNVIVSRNPPKEKLCTAYKNMEQCTQQLQCGSPSDFNKHSMRVMDTLLTPYDKYCRGFVATGSNRTVPPWTGTGPTPGPGGSTVPQCNEDLYLEQYFDCGLTFLFNLPGANVSDHRESTKLVCELARNHKGCVDNIKTITNCPLGIGIHANLDYFDKELRENPNAQCTTGLLRGTGKKKFRASPPRCHLREYVGSYFECGATFLQATFPDMPSDDEACRLHREFLKCISFLIQCQAESDVQQSLKYFSDVLTEGYMDRCKDHNATGTCEKLVLIKNYFSCSKTYYQAYNEYGQSYLLTKPHICKLLEDYGKCVYDDVLKTSCDSLKELYSNVREVRNYIAKRFNERHKSSCSIPSGFQAKRGLLTPLASRQTSCDQFGAVKRLVLCGVAFHRMLTSSAESNASAGVQLEEENATTAVCPLVKEMKYCMYSATRDSGCTEALFLNTEMSTFRKRLLTEFEGTCDTLPWNDNGTVGGNKSRQSCELKEFTQEWEACDATIESGISLYNHNGSRRGKPAVTDLQRRRLCSDLVGYRRCVRDSAGRHHCPALAPGLADVGRGELLQRLGLVACSSSTSPGPCWAPQLVATASVAHFVARGFAGWLH